MTITKIDMRVMMLAPEFLSTTHKIILKKFKDNIMEIGDQQGETK